MARYYCLFFYVKHNRKKIWCVHFIFIFFFYFNIHQVAEELRTQILYTILFLFISVDNLISKKVEVIAYSVCIFRL